MKPCSAYCRPEEGVHVWVTYHRTPSDRIGSRSVDEMCGVGLACVTTKEIACLPVGTRFLVLSVDPAPEAPPSSSEGYPNAGLVTAKVFS